MAVAMGLVGHWPLDGDTRDISGNSNHGVALGSEPTFWANEGHTGARFAPGSGLVVANAPSINIGAGDFSVATWVHTDERLTDVLGNVASKYDQREARGFNFSLLNYTGVTSHHPNHRTVHFGIDDGSEPKVVDRGRPGTTVFVLALAVFDGDLYAGTYEATPDLRGRVYRYLGGDAWEDCGSPDASNAVAALTVHDGALYAGTARYKARGSALPDSKNTTPGGSVFRFAGGTSWIDCGRIDASNAYAYQDVHPDDIRSDQCDTVGMLMTFGGALYASPWYTEGVFRYDGGTSWVACGTPGRRLITMSAWRDHLLVAGHDGSPRNGASEAAYDQFAEVFELADGGHWSSRGTIPGVTQIYSYAVFGDALYAGAWPDGKVYRYAGDDAWVSSGRLGAETEVMAMAIYNGQLLAGSLPSGSVYTNRGGEAWDLVARLDWTPDVKYRRVWSMAVFAGQLFAGTLPTGRVHSIEIGQNVTYDRQLAAGWRHLGITRHGSTLELYVDGVTAARSDFRGPIDFSTTAPLLIGAGSHASFRGAIADIRLYDRALTATDLSELAKVPTPR